MLPDVHYERQAVEAVADEQPLLLPHAAIVETGNLRQAVPLLFVVCGSLPRGSSTSSDLGVDDLDDHRDPDVDDAAKLLK